MLKITQRGKRPERRCAYLSSISFRVLFRHPHKHRSDLVRLSENIRLKQQQTGFILESHPRTNACSALLTNSNRNADADTDVWWNYPSCLLLLNPNESKTDYYQRLIRLNNFPQQLCNKRVSVFSIMPSFSVYNRKINDLNTFWCYTSDCSLFPFDSENHHFSLL